jgi:hypothetical protein
MTDVSGPNSEPKPSGGEPGSAVGSDDPAPSSPPEAEFTVEEITITGDVDPEVVKIAIGVEKEGSRRGQTVGSIISLCGVVLIILGYSGNVTWKIAGEGISSSVQTGSLGIVVLIAGVIIFWISRPKIKITGPDNRPASAKGAS